jgi:casein kinase II subunit beta
LLDGLETWLDDRLTGVDDPLCSTLQAGLHDEWKKSEMKVYCPKCRDLYTPANEYQTPASMYCRDAYGCGVQTHHSAPSLGDVGIGDRVTNRVHLLCAAVDGAYFGTTFPHLFFLTYRELEPAPSTLLYVPRVFGYKIHNKSENRRRLAILAKEDEDEEKTQQQVSKH